MPDRSRRHLVRVFVLVLLSILAIGQFAMVLAQSWPTGTTESRLVTDERHRIAYLRPLAHLIGVLVEAESAAVQDLRVDTDAVHSAVDAVDAVDRAYHGPLGTGQRWSELRGRTEAVLARPGRGSQAYLAFADLTTLALDLVRRVGDTSDVLIDPQLDSYYVMEPALLRLPVVMVSAGRAADLATVAGGNSPTGQYAIQVAVARYDVANAAADANAGLSRGIEVTGRPALGASLAGHLDGFRTAVDEFAPPAILNTLAGPVDAYSLPPAAGSVRVTTLALADAVLSELDGLLTNREDTLAGQRQLALGAGTGGLVAVLALVVLAVLWLLRTPVSAPVPAEAAEPGVPLVHPAERVPGDLVDVHDLLDFEELVQARRRTVRAWPQGSDDNAG
jgi:hypothetical protein